MFSRIFKTVLPHFVGFVVIFCPTVLAAVPANATKLVYCPGPTYADCISYNLSDATKILEHPKFVFNETHMYLHGHSEKQQDESIHVIIDAYLTRNSVNLILVDWSTAAGENYFASALANIEVLAPALSDVILEFYSSGLKRESFTMVAHSLGAQLTGMIGRQVMKKTNGNTKIYYMILLDAAFPLFFNTILLPSVNRNDAEYVQAIHTDINTYGQPKPIGHVDFWPNGGYQGQPGCPTGFLIPFSSEDLCSHQRSWRFYAESVAHADGPYFWSYPSSSYIQFLFDGARNKRNKAIQMGFNCPMDARGNYYLKTNSAAPFAMGVDGY